MKVKHSSDTYKISWENSKSGREVGVACINKWNWSWFKEKKCYENFISGYIRKIAASGLAFCIYYDKPLSYGSSGKKIFYTHARNSSYHLCNKKDYRQTTYLPFSWSQSSTSSELSKCSPKWKECNLPYGIAVNVYTSSKCPTLWSKSNPVLSLKDHKH